LDNEIAEAALIAIENLIRKCPSEARSVVSLIYDLVSQAIAYDPNYQSDPAQGANEQMMDDEDNQDADMDDQEYDWASEMEDGQDDDDDTAWKVRKGATKVIDAMVSSCPESLREYWQEYVALLERRFFERDENVKCDVFETFQNLIKASLRIGSESSQAQAAGMSPA